MLVKEVAARGLLSAMVMRSSDIFASPDVFSSPNPMAGLAVRQSGSCDVGQTACTDGCMPIGSVCCTSRGTYCTVGNYCMPVSGCCRVGDARLIPALATALHYGCDPASTPSHLSRLSRHPSHHVVNSMYYDANSTSNI